RHRDDASRPSRRPPTRRAVCDTPCPRGARRIPRHHSTSTHYPQGDNMTLSSAGAAFRAAVSNEKPLQVVGAINAYTARMAEATGFKALYLSGGGVAANSLGMPDLGISTMEDVLTDVRRIT